MYNLKFISQPHSLSRDEIDPLGKGKVPAVPWWQGMCDRCGQIPMPPFLSTLFLFSRRHMNAGNSYPDVVTLLDRLQMGVLQGSPWSLAISRGQKDVCTPSRWCHSFSHQFVISFPHFLIKCIFTCQAWCFSCHVFFQNWVKVLGSEGALSSGGTQRWWEQRG